jgi:hypothetical protein
VLDDRALLSRVRKILLALLAVGTAGTALELLLLGHFEEPAQIAPLLLGAVGVAAAIWHFRVESRSSSIVLGVAMALFVVSGFVGVVLHYQGNVEFELEMYPDIGGFELLGKTVTGATPVLAPGTMALLGLVGLAALYGGRR